MLYQKMCYLIVGTKKYWVVLGYAMQGIFMLKWILNNNKKNIYYRNGKLKLMLCELKKKY